MADATGFSTSRVDPSDGAGFGQEIGHGSFSGTQSTAAYTTTAGTVLHAVVTPLGATGDTIQISNTKNTDGSIHTVAGAINLTRSLTNSQDFTISLITK